MAATSLSHRAAATLASLDQPWRFAPRQTYHPQLNPDGLISFATAENTLVTDELQAFVQRNVNIRAEDFLYKTSTAGGTRFPKALALHLNEYFDPMDPVRPGDIQVTGAATAMHDVLAWAVANPGDGILTSRPVYGRFELDFGNKSQVRVVYADTTAENSFGEDVVDRLEEALQRSNANGVRIRALLIVNPHNPLGKCYPRQTLVKIMTFCQKHHIHLISDEIYACSVFDTGEEGIVPFTSVLAVPGMGSYRDELVHVTYGLSKDFGAAGLRLGAVITRSTDIQAAVNAAMRFHNPSGASLAIGSAMLEDRAWCRAFITQSTNKLAAARAHITAQLREMGISYLSGCNAGFFVWVDLSQFLARNPEGKYRDDAEFALAQKILDAGLFLHPKEEHSTSEGWFRIVYSQDAAVVTEGLRR